MPRMRAGVALSLALALSACLPAPAPTLVRDRADIFSAEAEAAAEARLQALARATDRWAFVITEDGGDPPRMLDEPMRLADDRDIDAIAVLLDSTRMIGAGLSGASATNNDAVAIPNERIFDLLQQGQMDAALELIVEDLEAWASAPQRAS